MDQNTQPVTPPENPVPKPPDAVPPPPEQPQIYAFPPKKSHARTVIALIILVILLSAAGYLYYSNHTSTKKNITAASTTQNASKISSSTGTAAGLQLNPTKNYGNKYASGLLPVGDNKYSATESKTGYIYVCSGYANNIQNAQGGAGRRGPWFVGTTQYNINQKTQVRGSVTWQSSFSNTVSGDTRTISSNGLPNHATGIYPIQATDPAYVYDKNPNSIKAQSFTYSLSANPTYGTPHCMGGQVGVMLTGAALFNGFDAAGRDAGAWEVQDGCSGHPEKTGTYHYHTLSSCIKDVSVSTVIGYALDGFPITGPKVGDNNFLTTSDLDECHGIVSQVTVDGKKVTTYHYVMTQDFPYSASCFRSTAIDPPGSHQTTGQKPPSGP